MPRFTAEKFDDFVSFLVNIDARKTEAVFMAASLEKETMPKKEMTFTTDLVNDVGPAGKLRFSAMSDRIVRIAAFTTHDEDIGVAYESADDLLKMIKALHPKERKPRNG